MVHSYADLQVVVPMMFVYFILTEYFVFLIIS